MKYIKTFEDFINENESYDDINEGVKFADIKKIAKEFLSATETKFKVSDSQIAKQKLPVWKGPKKVKETSYRIAIVVPDKMADKAREFAKEFKEKHEEEIKDLPIMFSISTEVEGRKTLWPTDNKNFFDI
jgi:hypothetical protein